MSTHADKHESISVLPLPRRVAGAPQFSVLVQSGDVPMIVLSESDGFGKTSMCFSIEEAKQVIATLQRGVTVAESNEGVQELDTLPKIAIG